MIEEQPPLNPGRKALSLRAKLLIGAAIVVLTSGLTVGLLTWLGPRPATAPTDPAAETTSTDSLMVTGRAYAALHAQDHTEALRLFKQARQLALAEGRGTSEIAAIDEQIELVNRQLELEAANAAAMTDRPSAPMQYRQEVVDGVTYILPSGSELAR